MLKVLSTLHSNDLQSLKSSFFENFLLSNVILRPYQTDLIEKLRLSFKNGHRRVVLSAPTGSGKTVLFSYMVSRHTERGGKALILTHRDLLLEQAAEGLRGAQLITANTKTAPRDVPISIGMVETFHSRRSALAEFIRSRTMVVFDECHLENFTKIFPLVSPTAFVIGASATPYRRHNQHCLSEFYTDLIQGIDTPELIAQGYLSNAVTYSVPIDLAGLKKTGDDYDTSRYYTENKTYRGVVANYLKHTPNQKAVLFASNIENSKEVCKEFQDVGIQARHLDGFTSPSERENLLRWYRNTPNAVLCNCGVATTGFNVPDISCIILYRATVSLPLFLQMCGRGSRIAEGKERFTILDFGGNVARLGFWQEPREWSLKKQPKRDKGAEKPKPLKVCPECEALLPMPATSCEFCGYVYPAKGRGGMNEEILLTELRYKPNLAKNLATAVKERRIRAKTAWAELNTLSELRGFAREMKYGRGWAMHVWRERG